MEIVLTTLHAGGKFNHKIYQTSGGLHGVGVSVVNALSKSLLMSICRQGRKYEQHYSDGKPKGLLYEKGKADRTGTEITFLPSTDVFSSTEFDFATIEHRLRELAFLNSGSGISNAGNCVYHSTS